MRPTPVAQLLRRTGLGLAAAATLAASVVVQAGTAPVASAAEDPLCITTPSSGDPFYRGPSASTRYDELFRLSQPVPEHLLTDRYDPQGLATWTNWDGHGEDVLLVSAYHDGDGDKTPDGYSGVFGLVINGPRAGTGLGRMLVATGHVGGIGVYGGFLYVGSEKTIKAYPLSTVRGALAGANTNHVYGPSSTYTSSYTVGFMGTGDGHLWAGEFDEDAGTHLNGYVQTDRSTGKIAYQSATQAYAPKKTQGVVVTSTRVIFSTSYTREDRGNLWVMGRNQHSLTDGNSFCTRAPSMNEGVTAYRGGLYLLFESAAYTYTHDASDLPRNRIDHLHRADLATVAAQLGNGD